MKARLSIAGKGLILISAPILLEVALIAAFGALLYESEAEAAIQSHQKAVHITADSILTDFEKAAAQLSKMGPKPLPAAKTAFTSNTQEVSRRIATLERLGVTAQGSKEIHDFCHLSHVALETLQKANPEEDNQKTLGRAREIIDQLRSINRAQTVYFEEHSQSKAELRSTHTIRNWLFLGLIVNLSVTLAIAYYFFRTTSKRLNQLTTNAVDLSNERPIKPQIEGTDEIAELDEVFHKMAASLDLLKHKERALAENVTDVICTVDQAGSVTKMNHAAIDVLGRNPEELLGKRYLDLIAEEDRTDVTQMLKNMSQSNQGETFESRTVLSNGTMANILWSGHWSESENSYYFVAHDITKRKRQEQLLKDSEAKVRGILESMPVGIFMLDENDNISFVNQPLEKMFNATSFELVGQSAFTLFAKYPQNGKGEHLDSVDSKPHSFRELLARCSGPGHDWESKEQGGKSFQAELTVQNPTDQTKRNLVVAVLDVTAEREVQRMRQELISIVSHELRSPLTSLKGFLTLVLEGVYGDVSPKLTDRAQRAHSNVERLMKLVNDLLQIEKLESGVMALDKKTVVFAVVLQQATDSLQQVAESAGITLKCLSAKQDREDHEELHIDTDRITQVLINFISNAIKFSDRGQSVEVCCRRMDDDWFEASVTDHGRGVPPSAKERIFERFQQVDTSDHKSKGGTGLGLAICRAIIEQHEGTIGVDSTLGEGSTFWFRLPPSARVLSTPRAGD